MPSKLQLLPADIAIRLKQLPERVTGVPDLTALWLFGSFARGEATPVSDVDLAYLADETLTGDALDQFETKLYSTIASTLRSDEFTFVNLRKAPPVLAWRVVTQGRRIFSRDEETCVVIVEAALQRFPDLQPYLRERWRAVDDWLEGKPMVVDRARVYLLLEGIREEIGLLREVAALAREPYLADKRGQRVAERCLQRAAEGCISIGNHLTARLGLRPPADYADVFRGLGEAKILPGELAQQMMDMARFRNLLVHVYWAIEHDRVYDSLSARLTALETFSRQIAQWLKEHDPGQ